MLIYTNGVYKPKITPLILLTNNKIMEIQKFTGILCYYPTTFLKDENWLEYNYTIMPTMREVMRRRQYGDYSKYFLYESYKKIEKELTQIIKKRNNNLSIEELKFLTNLLDLVRHIKRFSYDNKTRTFPNCYGDLTTDGLVAFIDNINQLRKFKKDLKVLMLQTDEYLRQAEQLWPAAEEYYYKSVF